MKKLLFVFLVTPFLFISCASLGVYSGNKPIQITYQVVYSTDYFRKPSFTVSYINPGGGTSMIEVKDKNDWKYTFNSMPGQHLYLLVGANNKAADITVSILAKGLLLKSSTSHGDFVSADVSSETPVYVDVAKNKVIMPASYY